MLSVAGESDWNLTFADQKILIIMHTLYFNYNIYFSQHS